MRKIWTSRHTGPVLIVLAAVLWGLDGLIRRSLFSLPAITIVFYEHLIGAILILPFFLRVRRTENMSQREWLSVLWVSLLSGVLGTLFFTTALARTNYIPLSVVFLLQKLQPIFAILAGVVVLRERLNKKFLGWALLALGAAYFVTFPGGRMNLETGGATASAALLALGAAIAWGSSTAFSRYALLRHSQTYITGARFLITTGLAFLFVIGMGQMKSLQAPSPSQFGLFALIAVSTGMVALWIYYRGLKFTQAKITTLLELAFPLTGIAIDWIIYKTVLFPGQYFAGAVLIWAMQRISVLNREVDGYCYRAQVEVGQGRGKQIGFPTLNLVIPENFPHHHGIYAGRVSWDNHTYPAAIHYGPIPTFGKNNPTLEAYILEKEIPEPPAELELRLANFLRPIRRYENPAELRGQITKDVAESKKILTDK
ncbi:MAG: EamA family transporter [Candidatus Liptonbacteria bacterium]